MTIISPNTLFIGRNLIHLDECASTNSYAIDAMGRQNIVEGTIIYTHHQTQGRGQRGNQWQSEKEKNLTFSLVLLPKWLDVSKQFYLTKLVSVSVVEVLKQFGIEAMIKWPNDIFVNDRKLGGILVENMVQNGALKSTVIGVGLNVNQMDFAGLPATSMQQELGRPVELQDVLNKWCEYMEAHYLALRNHLSHLDKAYLNAMYRRGEMHSYRVGEETVIGEIIGVNEEGKLLMNIQNQLQKFGMKEIQFII